MPALYLNQVGLICALGAGAQQVCEHLFAPQVGGVAPNTNLMRDREFHLGIVSAPLMGVDVLPPAQRSRNNALLLTALAQIRPAVDTAIARYGSHRVAVVLGTSTSGIAEAEYAMRHHSQYGHFNPEFDLSQQELASPALALSGLLGLSAPALVISTACSSSAKAMASAARMLRLGAADAVITGGMDALCSFTVAGFSTLESVSAERCNPFSANRHGINIGEGGALFLMTREPSQVRLAGWGESSDAYHISAPAPDGRGALLAMRQALDRANLNTTEIDYINLHGTATRHNDSAEGLAVHQLFGSDTYVSSTKPLTGHTLGGAGALEAALAYLTLTDNPQGRLPTHWWDGVPDVSLSPLRFVKPNEQLGRPVRTVLSNSFAFGGSNASLIFAGE